MKFWSDDDVGHRAKTKDTKRGWPLPSGVCCRALAEVAYHVHRLIIILEDTNDGDEILERLMMVNVEQNEGHQAGVASTKWRLLPGPRRGRLPSPWVDHNTIRHDWRC